MLKTVSWSASPGAPSAGATPRRATPRARGTVRLARHVTPSVIQPVSEAERRRVLHGLRGVARRVARDMLAWYGDWSPGALEVLRSYALSCQRLSELEARVPPDVAAIHREQRHRSNLWRTLHVGGAAPRRFGPVPSAPPNPFTRNMCPRDSEE